jgi:predicted DNA-binding transcriptional regulator YafY
MVKQDATSRLMRLDQLKGLLRERDHVVAAELARELGVSLRTLSRDLVLLRDGGVPVEADRGRGGGLRLERSWSMGRIHLSSEEAIDLLLSMAIAEKLNSPLLLRHLQGLRRKLVASFGETYRDKIRQLRTRILVGNTASGEVLKSYVPPTSAILPIVTEAFFNMRGLEMSYEDAKGKLTGRVIEPHYLYYAAPVWYLLAQDLLRRDVRHFRVDRIRQAKVLDSRFRLSDPKPFLVDIEAFVQRV